MKYSFFLVAALLFITTTQAQVNPPSVKIGTQTWMVKNLDVDHYRNGDPIPEVKNKNEWTNLTIGAWCYYDNKPANGKTYGKLYNWYAVNDPRGLAPTGWHIPSDTEWTTLSNGLGGDEVAGGKMKETGTTHWITPNTRATNGSGFTALPGGLRFYKGSFFNVGNSGFWWNSTESHTATVWIRYLSSSYGYIYRSLNYKQSGFSVRCVKD